MTHLSGDKITEIVTKPNKINLDDIPEIDKKQIKVTGNLESALKRSRTLFDKKEYAPKKGIDCFKYIESIIRKINPSIPFNGDSNFDKFTKLCSKQ